MAPVCYFVWAAIIYTAEAACPAGAACPTEVTTASLSWVQKKVKQSATTLEEEAQAFSSDEQKADNFKASYHRLQGNVHLLARDCKVMGETARDACDTYREEASHSLLGQASTSDASPYAQVLTIASEYSDECRALESSASLIETAGNTEAAVLSLAEAAAESFASFETLQAKEASSTAAALGTYATYLGSSPCTLFMGSSTCSQAQQAMNAVVQRMDAWANESNGFANQAAQLQESLGQSVKASGLTQANATKRQAAILEEHVSRLADLVDDGRRADEGLSKDVAQMCGSLASQLESLSSLLAVKVLAGTITSAIASSMRKCNAGLASVESQSN